MSNELSREFLSKAVAKNRELSGLPPQSATYCCFRDPSSPRVCDRWRGHEGPHYDSTLPPGEINRQGVNQAIRALELEAKIRAGEK
jgi:hypothetical protein